MVGPAIAIARRRVFRYNAFIRRRGLWPTPTDERIPLHPLVLLASAAPTRGFAPRPFSKRSCTASLVSCLMNFPAHAPLAPPAGWALFGSEGRVEPWPARLFRSRRICGVNPVLPNTHVPPGFHRYRLWGRESRAGLQGA